MTVSSQVVKQVFSGNGSTTVFPIPFEYMDASEVGVYYVDANLNVSEVTTNLNINTITGEVTYPVDTLITPAIQLGTKIVIIRETPKTQEVDLENYGFFVPQVIENAFDKLTRELQDLTEKVSRCVAFPFYLNPTVEDTQNYLKTLTELKNQAQQFKLDAETAANSAAADYDSFDDRYLGAKSIDPTHDNDGNAILVGALYFNTLTLKMKTWTGTFWDNVGSIATQIKYTLLNNQTLSDITGFTLNSLAEKSASFTFEVERIGSSEYRQIIQAQAIFSAGAWSMTFGNYSGSDLIQDSLTSVEGITLSITPGGQVQYSSGNLPGHSGSSLKVVQTRMEA